MANSYGEEDGFCALSFLSKLESDQGREQLNRSRYWGAWRLLILLKISICGPIHVPKL